MSLTAPQISLLIQSEKCVKCDWQRAVVFSAKFEILSCLSNSFLGNVSILVQEKAVWFLRGI